MHSLQQRQTPRAHTSCGRQRAAAAPNLALVQRCLRASALLARVLQRSLRAAARGLGLREASLECTKLRGDGE